MIYAELRKIKSDLENSNSNHRSNALFVSEIIVSAIILYKGGGGGEDFKAIGVIYWSIFLAIAFETEEIRPNKQQSLPRHAWSRDIRAVKFGLSLYLMCFSRWAIEFNEDVTNQINLLSLIFLPLNTDQSLFFTEITWLNKFCIPEAQTQTRLMSTNESLLIHWRLHASKENRIRHCSKIWKCKQVFRTHVV